MHCFLKKIILFLVLTIGLQAQGGLSQNHLLSVSPTPSQESVSTDTTIEIEFNLAIIAKSVKKHTIVLKSTMEHGKSKKIAGKTILKNETTLLFIPSETLKSGTYGVKVKKVKLLDYTIDTRFKRFAKKMCSHFYDDVKDCRMYRYASRVKSKKIHYSFSVDDNSPSIVSITLDKSNIQLNENNQTAINVSAFYDDNTTADVTQSVEWIIGNSSIISITNNIITPKKEGTTTLQAKYNNITSTKIQVTVHKEINGYILPPQPDETLNNSTLLGIDVNNNGVRDDVERWIFLDMEIYNGYEKIEQAIAMQEAKAFQMTLIDPTNKDDIVDKAVLASIYCWSWYRYSRSLPLQDRHLEFSRAIKDKMFNTKERLKTYWQYDSTLAGSVTTLMPTLQTKSQCEIDIDEL